MRLTGTKLVGSSPKLGRPLEDYYATPFEATRAILDRECLKGSILEPASGEGHMVKVLREYYPDNEIIATDLIERKSRFDIPIQGKIDFLTYDYGRTFNNVITNPPFKYITEFVTKALEIATDKVLMFGKIQLLEGAKRTSIIENAPLKKIYVFTKRVNPYRNREETDENGKPWSSTMCFAWFVWDKTYTGLPTVERM